MPSRQSDRDRHFRVGGACRWAEAVSKVLNAGADPVVNSSLGFLSRPQGHAGGQFANRQCATDADSVRNFYS
ncbi:MAG: hypothetical protein MUC60_17405 [Oscillatoria sp. Prado101]|nr:hypothetical protein [Oscillatoria sp. Prado101]